MSDHRKIRLFLDSNVLLAGIVSGWGLDKAVLSLCAARVCSLVLAEIVREEVEENLLVHAQTLRSSESTELITDYSRLIELIEPELVPRPSRGLVDTSVHLIRHVADVPVLLSAMESRPDWLLTHNTKHFNRAVATRTRLRIATPVQFFKALASQLNL